MDVYGSRGKAGCVIVGQCWFGFGMVLQLRFVMQRSCQLRQGVVRQSCQVKGGELR